MNMFAKILAVLTLAVSVQSQADSRINDVERLASCGGVVVLSSAANGDLAIKFEGLSTNRCNTLRFYDVTSGRTLKSYNIQGTSYTLSKTMESSLSQDCRVGFTVSGPYGVRDNLSVVLNWCSYRRPAPQPRQTQAGLGFQLSNAGNCKVMSYGQYANKLSQDDSFCSGAQGKQIVSYEWSNNNNCKRMIDGRYSNVNVSDRYCTARF